MHSLPQVDLGVIAQTYLPPVEISSSQAGAWADPSSPRKKFDPLEYLTSAGPGRTLVRFAKKSHIFEQGDPGHTLFYIQKGRVRLTTVSSSGKEATLGLLSVRD